MQFKITAFLAFILCSMHLQAQEFTAEVEVVHPKIQTNVEEIFKSLEASITNFINGNKFTNDVFTNEERIQINLVLNIKTMEETSFTGDLQISGVRPIYDTDLTSPLFRIKDDEIEFTYRQYEAIEFSEGAFTSNLASILTFYAYFALGMDYDSFSEEGGTAYFNKALDAVNTAQSSGKSGWSPSDKEKDNRYWLVFQMLDSRFKELRKTLYTYHRQGMDQFTQDSEKARSVILGGLENLIKVHKNSPNSYLLQVFLESKRQEIINIFSKATTSEKNKLYSVIQIVDIANLSKYKTQLDK